MLRGYKSQLIYNADETGLFVRTLPVKTLVLKFVKFIGGELSKERFTVLYCVNLAGKKQPLLVIGKAARPRA